MSTLPLTRTQLAGYLKLNPKDGHAKVVKRNLDILAGSASDKTKADVLNALPANVERFRKARAERILPKQRGS